MKIEFPGNYCKQPLVSEQGQKNRSDKVTTKSFKSDKDKFLEASSMTKPELLQCHSIMRLDVSLQSVPMKASDILTAVEMEMLEKLFSDMRFAKGSGEYGKK